MPPKPSKRPQADKSAGAKKPKKAKKKKTATVESDLTNIFLVRHAQRADETEGEKFQKFFESTTRPYDPPITDKGMQQTKDLVDYLSTNVCPDNKFRFVFSSPLLRCVQTSAIIASSLKLPLVLVPGFAECVKNVRRQGIEGEETFATLEEMKSACNELLKPLGLAFPKVIDMRSNGAEVAEEDKVDSFEDALFGALGSGLDSVLIVSHREAFKSIGDMCEGDITLPRKHLVNCILGRFQYSSVSGMFSFKSLDVSDKSVLEHKEYQAEARKVRKRRQKANKKARKEAAEAKRRKEAEEAKRKEGKVDGDEEAVAGDDAAMDEAQDGEDAEDNVEESEGSDDENESDN